MKKVKKKKKLLSRLGTEYKKKGMSHKVGKNRNVHKKTAKNPKGAGKARATEEPDCITRADLTILIHNSMGIISHIAEAAEVSRTTIYKWLRNYDWVREAIADAESRNLDIAENSLITLVKRKDLGACCFYLKCKGKKRGYIEKSVIQFDNNPYEELDDDDLDRRIQDAEDRISQAEG